MGQVREQILRAAQYAEAATNAASRMAMRRAGIQPPAHPAFTNPIMFAPGQQPGMVGPGGNGSYVDEDGGTNFDRAEVGRRFGTTYPSEGESSLPIGGPGMLARVLMGGKPVRGQLRDQLPGSEHGAVQPNRYALAAEALQTPRDELMNTSFGRGISRTVMGGPAPGSFAGMPVSAEDTRRRENLPRLRAEAAEQESFGRGLAMTPEAAMARLRARVPGTMEEGGFRPSPGVHTTPIDESKAGPAREARARDFERRRARVALNNVQKKFLPVPVAQDMMLMQWSRHLPPQQFAAMLNARVEGQKSQLAHALGYNQLGLQRELGMAGIKGEGEDRALRGRLGEGGLLANLLMNKESTAGLGKQREASAAKDLAEAENIRLNPRLNDTQKLLLAPLVEAANSERITLDQFNKRAAPILAMGQGASGDPGSVPVGGLASLLAPTLPAGSPTADPTVQRYMMDPNTRQKVPGPIIKAEMEAAGKSPQEITKMLQMIHGSTHSHYNPDGMNWSDVIGGFTGLENINRARTWGSKDWQWPVIPFVPGVVQPAAGW